MTYHFEPFLLDDPDSSYVPYYRQTVVCPDTANGRQGFRIRGGYYVPWRTDSSLSFELVDSSFYYRQVGHIWDDPFMYASYPLRLPLEVGNHWPSLWFEGGLMGYSTIISTDTSVAVSGKLFRHAVYVADTTIYWGEGYHVVVPGIGVVYEELGLTTYELAGRNF